MALVTYVLYALLLFGANSYGKPQSKQRNNQGNKLTSQDLLDIIANSDNAAEDLKAAFASGFVKQKVNKPVNKTQTESDSKVQSSQGTTARQVTIAITATTPNNVVPKLNQNIGPASSGYWSGQSVNSWSVNGQGYGHSVAVGEAQVSAIQNRQVVQDPHIIDVQVIGIQGAHATELAARAGQSNAIQKAQALDAVRAGNIQRAQAASFEYARAAEAARLAAAGVATEMARAQEAARIANAAHFQADRIANAARTNLAIAAARPAGTYQVSNIVNSATLAIQAARETEALARAGQVNAMRNAQALDAMRVGNVQKAQAAVWENTRAAESARHAAAGTVEEMARAAEAERVAYAARVRANAIANLAAAQANNARNAQESALYYGGYGNYYGTPYK